MRQSYAVKLQYNRKEEKEVPISNVLLWPKCRQESDKRMRQTGNIAHKEKSTIFGFLIFDGMRLPFSWSDNLLYQFQCFLWLVQTSVTRDLLLQPGRTDLKVNIIVQSLRTFFWLRFQCFPFRLWLTLPFHSYPPFFPIRILSNSNADISAFRYFFWGRSTVLWIKITKRSIVSCVY